MQTSDRRKVVLTREDSGLTDISHGQRAAKLTNTTMNIDLIIPANDSPLAISKYVLHEFLKNSRPSLELQKYASYHGTRAYYRRCYVVMLNDLYADDLYVAIYNVLMRHYLSD